MLVNLRVLYIVERSRYFKVNGKLSDLVVDSMFSSKLKEVRTDFCARSVMESIYSTNRRKRES